MVNFYLQRKHLALIIFVSFISYTQTLKAQNTCLNASAFANVAASPDPNTTITISTCQYTGEYATITGIVAGRVYRVNSSVTSDWAGVRRDTPTGAFVHQGQQGGVWVAPVTGTYYIHWNNSSWPTCGGTSTCRTTSITTLCPGNISTLGYELAEENTPVFTAASACSNGEIRMGAGAWRDITLTVNTRYNWVAPGAFGSNGNQLRVRPLNGGATAVILNAGQSLNGWNSGTTTLVRVSVNRSNCFWAATSNILTYRHTQPEPVTVSGGGTFCSNATLTASGGANGTIFWQSTIFNPGTSTATASTSQNVTTSGTYYFRSGNNGCWGTLGSATVTIQSPPTNPTGITGTSTICNGGSTVLTIAGGSNGSGATYQWYAGGCGSGTVLGTGASLTVSPTSNTTYFVRRVGSTTCTNVTDCASLLINVNPTSAVGAISSNQSICSGASPANITVASSTGTVQWQQANDAGFTSGVVNIGGNSNTLTSAQIGALTATRYYRAIVTSGICPPIISNVHTVTVSPTTVGGTLAGGSTPICQGVNTGTITLSGNVGAVVRWEKRVNAGLWTNVANTTTIFSEVPSSAGTWEYRALVQSGVCPNAYSSVRTIVVSPTSAVGTASTNQTICSGSSPADITLASSTGTVQWQQANDVAFTSGVVNIGANSNTLTSAQIGTLTATRYFRAIVTSGVCPATNSNIVTITVNPTTVGGTLAGGSTPICQGVNTGTITLSGNVGTVVRWEKRVNAGAWANVANTTTTFSEVPTSAGTWEYRALVQSGVCPNAYSSIRTIVVSPTTVAGTASANQTICSGLEPANLSLTGSTGTIQWQVATNAAFTAGISDITGATSATLTSAQMGALTATRYYRAVVTSGACPSVNSNIVTITVDPTTVGGTLAGGSTPICQGVNTGTITLSGNVGTVVRWEKRVNAGAWANVANTTTTFSEVPTSAGTWEYRALVQSGVCPNAYSSIRTIVVSPTTVAGTASANQTICSGLEPANLSLTGSTGTIQWQVATNAAFTAGISDITGATSATLTSAQMGALTSTRYYRAVVTSGACPASNSNIVTITVDPTTAGGTLAGGSTPICQGVNTGTITLSGNVGTVVRWEKRVNTGAWANVANTTTTFSEVPTSAGTWEYRALVQSGVCPNAYSSIRTIVVSPTTVAGTASANQTICSGLEPASLSLTGSTGTIQWQVATNAAFTTGISDITGATSATLTSAQMGALTATRYYRAVVTSGACPSVNSNIVTITVDPVSNGGTASANQTICSGTQPAPLDLTGNNGTIQWQVATNLAFTAGVTNITGATTATLSSVQMGTLTATRYYRAVVTNGVCPPANSNIITITVDPVSNAGTASSNQSICTGTEPNDLTLTGFVGNIQWQSANNLAFSSGVVNISGATNATLTSAEMGTLTANRYYRAVVTNGVCPPANSNIISVIVNDLSVSGTASANQEICSGSQPADIVLVGNTGAVQWQSASNIDFTNDLVNIAGATNNTLTSAQMGTLTSTRYYRALVTSGACSVVNSNIITVFVNPTSVGGLATSNQTICSGTSPNNLTLIGAVGSIQWQVSSVADFSSGVTNILGANTSTLSSAQIGVLQETRYYRAIVTSGVCPPAFSNIINITVVDQSEGGIASSNQVICEGTSPANINLIGHSGDIQWQSATNQTFTAGLIDILGATNPILTGAQVGVLNEIRYFRAKVTNVVCPPAYSNTILVQVSPLSAGGTATANQTICNGEIPASISLVGNVGTIQWQSATNLTFTSGVTSIAGATSSTLNGSQIGALTSTRYFRAIVTSGVCSPVFSNVVTITASPDPASIAGTALANQSICEGNAASNITLNGSTGNIQWQVANDADFTLGVSDIVGATSTTLSSAQIGTLSATKYYRAIVTSALCNADTSNIVSITVSPAPNAGTASANQSICNGAQPNNLVLTGSTGNIQWQSANNLAFTNNIINIAGANTATLTNTQMGALSGNKYYRAVVSSGNCNDVFSNIVSVEILSNQASIPGTVSTDQIICSGSQPSNISVSGHIGDIQWQSADDFDFTLGVNNIAGATSPVLLGSTIGVLNNTKYFRTLVTNGVCSSDSSSVITIEVTPLSDAGAASGNQTICNGTQPSNLSIAGFVGDIQWQTADNLAFTSDVYIIPSANSNILSGNQIGNLNSTRYYRAIVTNGICDADTSNIITVTVSPSAGSVAGFASSNQTICGGASPTDLLLSGFVGDIQWESADDTAFTINVNNVAGGINPTLTSAQMGVLNDNKYYRARVTNGLCSPVISNVVSILVTPPSVAGTASANQTICSGSQPDNIELTGFTGNIQWQSAINATFTNGLSNITGANTSILTSAQMGTLSATRYYRAIITNGICSSTISNTVTVQVSNNVAGVPGTISGNQTICSGSQPSNLSLSGSIGAIQWQSASDFDFTNDVIDIVGATNSILTGNQIGSLNSTTYFRAAVSSGTCPPVYSAVATIQVIPSSFGGIAFANQTICIGTSPIDINLSGSIGTIQWQSANNSDFTVGLSNISGATDTVLTSSQIGILNSTKYFRAVASNGICAPSSSNFVEITVLPEPPSVAGTAFADQTICLGTAPAPITLSGSSGDIQWQSANNFDFTQGVADITGANNAILTSSQMGILAADKFYRAIVTSGNCSQATSNVVTVSVEGLSVPGVASNNQTICNGSQPLPLSLTGFTGNIQWQSADNVGFTAAVNNISGATSATLASAQMGVLNTNKYYRARVTNGTCSPVFSNIVEVIVNPTPSSGAIVALDNIVCIGEGTQLEIFGASGDVQWQIDTLGFWQNVVGATFNTYNTPLLNTTTFVRALVSSGVCNVLNTNIVTINVNTPSVAGTASTTNGNICEGSVTTLNLVGNTGDIQWQQLIGATWTNINGATTNTYNTPILTTSTSYRAVLTSGVCNPEISNQVDIIVNPTPAAGTVTASISTICQGQTSVLTLAGSSGTIQWQRLDGAVWNNIAGATSATFTTPALTSTTTYRASSNSGVCPTVFSNAVTINVDVTTVAGTASTTNGNICEGSSTTLNLAGNTGNIQWQQLIGATWTNIVGATASSFNTPVLTSTTSYRAVVTSGVCASVNSNTVVITVNPTPAAGTVTASVNTICQGQTSVLTLAGSSGTIQWQRLDGAVWNNIAGATSATFTTPALTSTTTYRASSNSGVCPTVFSNSVTINVDVTTIAGTASTTNGNICEGSSTTLNLAGNTGNIQWQQLIGATWTNISGATASSFNTPILTSTTSYRAVVTSGVCASANSNTVVITVNPTPAAGTVTASVNTICQGQTSVLTLAGSSGTIQWQRLDGAVWNNIAGATSATFTTPALTSTTTYRASSNSGVCPTVFSNAVTINVDVTTVAGTASTTNGNICEGSVTTLNLVGNTGNIQWQQLIGATWTNIVGATASSFNTPVLTSTTSYRAVVTSGVCASVNSNTVVITVNPTPAAGTVTASVNTICQGQTSVLTLAGSSGTIQWQRLDGAVWNNIAGATSATFTTPALTSTTTYRASSNSGVCPTVFSNSVTINVDVTTVAGTASTTNGNICEGSSTTLNLAGNTGNIQWQQLIGATWTNISGATASSFNTPILTSTTSYRAVVTSGVCASANSNTVVITVNPTPAAGTVTASVSTICQGQTSVLTLAGSSGTIQWQRLDGAVWNNIAGATSATFTTPALTSTTTYRASSNSGVCPTVFSNAVTINVDVTTVAGTASTTNGNICEGGSTTLNLAGNTGNIQWQQLIGATWTNISGATASSFNTPILTSTTSYRAVVTSGVCASANSNTVVITVNPTPAAGTVTASVSTICQGQTSVLTLAGSSGTIQWQRLDGAVWNNIAGATSATFTTPALTSTTTYRASSNSGVCPTVFSNFVTINVDVTTVAGTASTTNPNICQGAVTTINLTGNTGNIQWQQLIGATWTNISGATGSSYNTPPLAVSTSYRALVTSGVCNAATSNVVNINVSPSPVAGTASVSTNPICQNQTTTLTLTGSSGNIQWQRLIGAVWVNIAGETNPTFTTPALTTATSYRASVSSGVCAAVFSNVINVIVNSTTVAGIVSASSTNLCVGNVATVSVSGNVGTIQWQTNSSGTWTDIPGANSSSYNSPQLLDTISYRVVVTSGVCSPSISNEVTIFVTPSSISGNITASTNPICSGTNTTLTLSGFLGSIQWQRNIGGVWTNIAGATNPTFATPNLTATTSYRAVVTNGVCSSINSNPITIVVDEQSIAGTVTTLIPSICEGNSSQLSVSGTLGNIQWQTNASGTFVDIVGETFNNYTTPILTNSTAYRVVVTNGVCPAINSNTVNIIVEPQPVASVLTRIPTDAIVCQNQIIAASSTPGSGGGTSGTDQYQFSINTGNTWTNYTPGNNITTAGLVGNDIIQIRTRRVSTLTGCANTPWDVETWTLVPQPVAQNIVASITDAVVCEGALISATFINGSGGTGTITDVYEFSVNGGTTYFSYTPGNNIITNGSVGINTIRVRTRREATGLACNTSPWNEVSWSVNAQPIAQTIVRNPVSAEVCQGHVITATFTGGSGGTGSVVNNEYQYSIDAGNTWLTYTPNSGIPTASLLGVDIVQVRTRRVASGFACSNTNWNTETWTVVPQTSPQDIVPSTTDAVLCEGAIVSATFINGSGGTGTISDEYQFSVNAGVTWNTYIPGNNITTTGSVGTNSIKVRTRRLATGSSCATSAWNEYSWSIIAQPIAQNINRIPVDPAVCEGQDIAATFSGGSGGTGTIVNEYEFSTDFGATWSPYTPSSNISSTGILGIDVIQIRTRRTADGFACNASAYVVQRWTVVAQPIAQDIVRLPIDANVCTSEIISATFINGSGGAGNITNEYQFTDGGAWQNYIPGSPIASVGITGTNAIGIRTRRIADATGCNVTGWEEEYWNIIPQPISQDIVPSVTDAVVCEGALISATFINGSGGTGTITDEYEFSVNGGTTYFPYTPGNNILTTGSVGINTIRVRTRREATGLSCNTSPWNEVSWSVNAQPIAQTIVRNPVSAEVCQGHVITATFTGGSGGTGSVVNNEYQYSVDAGNTWLNYTPNSGIPTASLLGVDIVQVRTRRVASGFGCTNTNWNTETWTVVPQTSPQDIVPSTTDAVLCEGAIVSATFTNGSGGTGTISDEYQFSVNAGVTWNTYIPGDNITTAGSVGTNSIKVRTRRLATGSSCAASAWNEYSWSIIAQPIAQNINRLPADPAICEGQNIAATFSGGSGGTGTIVNEYEFSTDFGATWSPYTPSSNISSTGILGIDVIQIRTRRTADGFACNASAYVVQRWTVVAQPIAQDIVRLPIDTNVCTGEIISATFINGSGGAGNITNEYQFTDGGAWQTYIPGNPIASAGITGNNAIGIRTRRIADATGCNATAWEEEYWNIIPQPISQDIVPSVTDAVLCEGAIVSATFINGSGGTGIITDEYEVSTDAGTTWTTYTPGDDILTIGSVGTNTIRVRTRRVASGLSCATSPWNVYNWSIIAQPIAQTITRNPIDTAVCAGQIVSATFNGGSGGTGSTLVNQYEYSVDGGLNWGLYLANAGVSTAGLLGNDILHIRTRRVADGFACNNSPYNVETWTVEPQPVAQDIVRLPLDNIVCEGQDIAANFINGLGGAGVVSDEYQFSTDFGNTWTAYIPNDLISSIGLIGTDIIQIRTRKAATAAGCITTPWNTEKWSVVPQPTPPSFNPNVTPGLICAGTDISASFNVGAGGTGTIIEQFQFTIDGGITWNTYVENSIINTSAIAGTGILVIRGRRIASGLACDTSVWNQVVWNVAPLPFNPIVPNGQVCGTGTVTFSETTGTNEVVDWSYDTNTIIITNNTFTTPTMVGPDTINFFVRRRNTATNCISDWMPVQAVAIEQVVDPVIAHQIICGDNPVTYASTPLANHVTDWSTDANTVFLTNNDYTTPLINAPANDTIFVRYRDTISTCFSDWTIATAELFVIPVPPTIPDEIICGNGSVIINTLPPSIYTVEWALDTLGSITAGNTFTTPSLTAPDTLPVYVRYIEAVSLCQGPWSDLNAIASLLLQAGTIGEDTTICEDQFPHAFDNIATAVSTSPAGGVVSYTWQYQELCQGAWINIPNSDTTAYTENTPFQADRCYRRLATNNCGTDSSNVVRVNINLLPFVQFVGLLGEYCTDDSSSNFLYGLPLGGTFFGNGLNVNYFEPSTAPIGINTITYEYTDNNGCTNSMTDTTIIHPLPVVTIVSFNQGYCEDLNQPIPLSGTPANGIFTGVGVVGNDFVPALSQVGIQTITYSYTDTTGCDNSASTTVEVFPLPQPVLVGLFDTTCLTSPIIPISVSPIGGILTGNGISIDEDEINPNILNLGYETYTYTYIDSNGCVDTYIDSMWVNQGSVVVANNDDYIVEAGEFISFNVTLNDTGAWNYYELLEFPEFGGITEEGNGQITYYSYLDYEGMDSLKYFLCDDVCNYCDTGVVYFEVQLRGVIIPSGFSPDGDGINDMFVIRGLNKYPDNELTIFNRWGDLIYETKSYKNDWDGTTGNLSQKVSGNTVTDGTYFYILKLNDKDDRKYKGYVELKRNR
jgi:gliding motility-associated-like protein